MRRCRAAIAVLILLAAGACCVKRSAPGVSERDGAAAGPPSAETASRAGGGLEATALPAGAGPAPTGSGAAGDGPPAAPEADTTEAPETPATDPTSERVPEPKEGPLVADTAAPEPSPKTVDEAVDLLLAGMSSMDKLSLKRAPKTDTLKLHHTAGRWIRNNFLSGNKELPADCERLAGRRFRGYVRDDASAEILDALWEALQTLPLEDEERASRLWQMAEENYLRNAAREPARARLRELIERHPETDHAELARAKLKALAGPEH